jgi:hypothetical protein
MIGDERNYYSLAQRLTIYVDALQPEMIGSAHMTGWNVLT